MSDFIGRNEWQERAEKAEADLATEREVIATMHANMRKADAALAASNLRVSHLTNDKGRLQCEVAAMERRATKAEADSAALRAVLTEVLEHHAYTTEAGGMRFTVCDCIDDGSELIERVRTALSAPCDAKVECEGCKRTRDALAEWECLYCSGTGRLDAHRVGGYKDPKGRECEACKGSGLHPIARAALTDPTLPPGVVPGPTGATTGRLEDDLAAAHATAERLTRERDEWKSKHESWCAMATVSVRPWVDFAAKEKALQDDLAAALATSRQMREALEEARKVLGYFNRMQMVFCYCGQGPKECDCLGDLSGHVANLIDAALSAPCEGKGCDAAPDVAERTCEMCGREKCSRSVLAHPLVDGVCRDFIINAAPTETHEERKP